MATHYKLETTVLLAYTKYNIIILSSPVDQSTVEDGNDVAFIEVLDCSPPTYIANNYSNNTYFIFSLATWGKYKGNTQSINLLLSL